MNMCPECRTSRVIWSWRRCPTCGFVYPATPSYNKSHFPIFGILAWLLYPVAVLVMFWIEPASDPLGFILDLTLIATLTSPLVLVFSTTSMIRRERWFGLQFLPLIVSLFLCSCLAIELIS